MHVPYTNGLKVQNLFCRAGLELNAFLQAGADNANVSVFQCATDQTAIGFRAAETCFGLTSFQV